MAWEIETNVWGRFPHSIFVSSVWIFFRCYVFSSIVPCTHSTRKTMAWRYPGRRALKSKCVSWRYLKTIMEEKPSCQRKPFWGCIFALSRTWTKIKLVAQGGGFPTCRLPVSTSGQPQPARSRAKPPGSGLFIVKRQVLSYKHTKRLTL